MTAFQTPSRTGLLTVDTLRIRLTDVRYSLTMREATINHTLRAMCHEADRADYGGDSETFHALMADIREVRELLRTWKREHGLY